MPVDSPIVVLQLCMRVCIFAHCVLFTSSLDFDGKAICNRKLNSAGYKAFITFFAFLSITACKAAKVICRRPRVWPFGKPRCATERSWGWEGVPPVRLTRQPDSWRGDPPPAVPFGLLWIAVQFRQTVGSGCSGNRVDAIFAGDDVLLVFGWGLRIFGTSGFSSLGDETLPCKHMDPSCSPPAAAP